MRNSRLMNKVATFSYLTFCLGSMFGTLLVTALFAYNGEPVKKLSTYDAAFLFLVMACCIVASIMLTRSMQAVIRRYL